MASYHYTATTALLLRTHGSRSAALPNPALVCGTARLPISSLVRVPQNPIVPLPLPVPAPWSQS